MPKPITGRGRIGAIVRYCGHDATFIADVIEVGGACVVVANGDDRWLLEPANGRLRGATRSDQGALMRQAVLMIVMLAACVDGDDEQPPLPTCASISPNCARAAFCNQAGECVCDPDGAGPLQPISCAFETEQP